MVLGRAERHFGGLQDSHAGRIRQTPAHHAEHVAQVAKRALAGEQHQLKVILQQRYRLGDLKVAPVVPDAADQSETGAVLVSVGGHQKLG